MRLARSTRAALTVWIAVALAGCYEGLANGPRGGGDSGTSGGADADPTEGSEGGELPPDDPEPDEVGASALHLLTRTEYENSVRALLPSIDFVADELPTDFDVDGYASNAGIGLNEGTVDAYRRLAERAAEQAAASMDAVVSAAGCDLAEGDPCAEQFIEQFVRLAYRGSVPATATAEYASLYDTGGTPTDGLRLVITAVLQSPRFLYRVEVEGTDDAPAIPGVYALTPAELATRLAFALWKAPPDEELLDAAAAGELEGAGLVDVAARMMDDGRFRTALDRFHEQWMGIADLETLDRDASVFAEFSPQLTEDLRTETLTFLADVYDDPDASLMTMFNADYSFLNARLAGLYGVPAPGQEGFARVEFDAAVPRRGVLTHAGVLATYAKEDPGAAEAPPSEQATLGVNSPVFRGLFVRRRILCHELPPPPDTVDLSQPPVEGGKTGREILEERTSAPDCVGCHRMINGVGFAFGHYDALGRYRERDGSGPVDASGEMLHPDDNGEAFDGALELTEIIASRPDVAQCMVRQWFRFAMGREEAEGDATLIDDVVSAFEQTGHEMRSLPLQIVQSRAFRFRRIAEQDD